MSPTIHPWRQRLVSANWQLLWLIPIAIVVALAEVWWSRGDRFPDTAECSRLYKGAQSASDTLVADETIPNVSNPKFRDESVKCGVLRQLGKVP
jgi:hypothetical protein